MQLFKLSKTIIITYNNIYSALSYKQKFCDRIVDIFTSETFKET